MKMGISKTYEEWIHKNEPSFTEVMIQKEIALSINPKISIIIPTFNTSRRILVDAIVSVICQTYSNWELCIADGASTDKLTIKTIGEYVKKYPEKIKVNYLSENKGIVGNSNEALKMATGDYITFLDKIGFLREGFEGSQDYDLVLRATEQANMIVHISKILYHWRISKNSTAGVQTSKMYAYDSAKKALKEHLDRIGRKGEVKDGMFLSSYKIEYEIENPPLVSIIIPNHNHKSTLETCINSILTKTKYPNYEIVIVENSSTDKDIFEYYNKLETENKNIKVITWNSSNGFNFAAINNYAVDFVNGEYILFLNNDVEIINNDWLDRMVEYIVRKDVGIVGAKLYYPDGAIQHAGVMLGMGPVAGHPYCRLPKETLGYMGRAKLVQNLNCVTGACLMTKKNIFKEVGGFDEKFVLAFNDVDFCVKVHEHGYNIVWTPYAELYHYESKTRGYEDTDEKKTRFWGEVDIFRAKWLNILQKGDPYFFRKENYVYTKSEFSICNFQ